MRIILNWKLKGCDSCYNYDFKSDNTFKGSYPVCGPACDCFSCDNLIIYPLNVSWTWEYLSDQKYRIAPIN